MANRGTVYSNYILRLKHNCSRLLLNLLNLSETAELIPLFAPTLSPSIQLLEGTHKGRVIPILAAELSIKLSNPRSKFYQEVNH
jgi:hypothetical protein